ncbi:MAG: ATP-binding protein [Nocardioidaceae bacterium]
MCDYTPDSTCALPNSLQAPSFARGFVQSTLCREHAQTAEAVVTLLTDELVTQALLYGAPPVTVTLRCEDSEVTVEVSDAAPEPPERTAPDHELSRLLVDKISHSWGVERAEGGKTVWCRVPSGALPKPRAPLPWSVEPARAATGQSHRR